MTMRLLACALCALVLTPTAHAQRSAIEDAGIFGEVRTPTGEPVTGGSVALMSGPGTTAVTATIDKTGRFRIVPNLQGWMRLFISVPGFEPYRANVTVSSSRKITLPTIALREPAYFRVRFVSIDGEALPAAGFRYRLIDADGLAIPDPLGHAQLQAGQDGTITLGPLPRGRMKMAFDRPPLAPTRLPDVNVTGSQPLIDRGTITIAPGRTLSVDVIEGDGRLVPRHDVFLEDAVQPSALAPQRATTNEQGRAVFDRVGPGRYRLTTRTVQRCLGKQYLNVSRLVSAGPVPIRMIVGGRAAFRVTTPFGPLGARGVIVIPDAPGQPPWMPPLLESMQWRRSRLTRSPSPPSCGAPTDADGRVTFSPLPPGPTNVRVMLFNSAYIVRVTVPTDGREVLIAVPDGLMPVHVTDRSNGRPLGARLVWTGGGGRVEAAATANGDALLEAVGATGGTLNVSEREYQTVEGAFEETPGTLQEVTLLPLPSERVLVRVFSSDGAPIPDAVVEWWTSAADAAEFSATDAKGAAALTDVPPGALRLTAHVSGFAPATVQVPEEARSSIEIRVK